MITLTKEFLIKDIIVIWYVFPAKETGNEKNRYYFCLSEPDYCLLH
jgi:hypothetical protein